MVDEKENETILDVLLDEDNKEPITLLTSDGTSLQFEQIAVIPMDDRLYCVLKPIDKIENVSEDEAIVFYVDEDVDPPVLKVETDEQVANEVFEEYYDLLEEAMDNEEETDNIDSD